ncbi:glycosyltransferase [Lysobacter sp. H23M47]|uniref:glycosyltransferase n=1 Tax=Lysobacter sp. H23M47 TaxID=2781024 RepID=UPI00187E036F|nr:glycosyltransferase [Lysobacter sp. H23M47]QOW23777.1 glycosyltransferase [Lysobacter sp. H23M47]
MNGVGLSSDTVLSPRPPAPDDVEGGTPLRIALVTPILPVPYDRTRGRYIHETARALSGLTTVRVFLPQVRYLRLPGLAPRSFLHGEVGPDYRLDGIDLEPYTYPGIPGVSRATNGMVGARALTPRLRAFRPDLVLAYWIYPDGYAALRASRRLGVPCIVGARGSDIHVRSGINAYLTRKVLAGADQVLTVSEAMRAAAITTFGAHPVKVRKIVNGIDTAVFHPRERGAMRAQLGVDPEARLVVYVGRFVESKGLIELLQAFAAIASRDPRARLALVGDGVMRGQLPALLRAHGIESRVHLPGGMEPTGVAEWIGASDVLTLPSWSEGYPNVVVEAIACGCPVVVSDVGGAGEIVRKDNGLLVPPRDPAALERALAQALVADWDRTAMAASMRRGWHDVAVDTLDACRQVLANARPAGR